MRTCSGASSRAPSCGCSRTCRRGAGLLDLGAGHGIFAHLALAAGAREVVAVEPDGRKVFHIPPHPRLRVVNGYHPAVRGRFDAVTIFDVLYRLPKEDWDPLLRWVRERLAPGGVFLLKEIDPEHRAKALWNRAQERGADLLGLTLGEAFSYETRGEIRDRLAARRFHRLRGGGDRRRLPARAHPLQSQVTPSSQGNLLGPPASRRL